MSDNDLAVWLDTYQQDLFFELWDAEYLRPLGKSRLFDEHSKVIFNSKGGWPKREDFTEEFPALTLK